MCHQQVVMLRVDQHGSPLSNARATPSLLRPSFPRALLRQRRLDVRFTVALQLDVVGFRPRTSAFALFFLFGGIGGLSPSTYCRTAPTPSRQRGSGDAEDVLPCGVRGGGGPRQRQQKADAARRKPEHQKQEREQPVDEKRTRIARERRRTLRERVPE